MKKLFLLFVFTYIFFFSFAETTKKMLSEEKTEEGLSTPFGCLLFDWDLGFGIYLGESHELVYGSSGVLSDLRWPMYPAMSIFINTEFELKQGFHLKVNSDFCPKILSGKLTDKDYKYPNGKKTIVGDSIHNATLEWQYSVGGTLGWKFELPQTEYLKSKIITLYIEPLLGMLYSRRKWSGNDGYGNYDLIGFKEYSGKQITYELQKVTTEIGLDLHFDLIPKEVYMKTGFEIIPYYFSNSLDHHFLRDKKWYDEFKTGGFGVGLNTEVKWLFSNYIGLVFGAEYQFLLNRTGSTKIYSSDALVAMLPPGNSGQTSNFGKMNLGFFLRVKK